MLLFSSCSTLRVNYDYDPEADFTRLKTFDWLPMPADKRIDELVLKRIKDSVSRQLQAKGFGSSSETPDFLIALHGGKETKVNIADRGYNYSRRNRYRYYGDRRMDIYKYEEGTLILDFVDSKSNELIWRGSATDVLDPDPTPEQRSKKIDEAVGKILENFPPVP